MADKIEYIDREYARCIREGKPRLIKARMSSFRSIAKRFNDFRVSLLKGKLDRMKEKALTEKYKSDNFDKKIEKKSKAIAKLEEKIMLISKDVVPTDYVDKRAIKLKKAMIENLTHNSGLFYSIGLDNADKVFSTEEEEAVSIDVDGLHDDGLVSLEEEFEAEIKDTTALTDEEKITRDKIVDVVNTTLDSVTQQETIDEYSTKYDVPLEGELADVVADGTGDLDSSEPMSKEEIQNVINAAFNQVENTEVSSDASGETTHEEIDDDEIKKEVDDVIEKIKVSRNNVNSVRTDKYDESGKEKPKSKYQYVPMTDEEIRDSQRKLGFDENGNIIDDGVVETKDETVPLDDIVVETEKAAEDETVSREMPVVVDDRNPESAVTTVFEDEEDKTMFEVIEEAKVEPTDEDKTAVDPVEEFSIVDSEDKKETHTSTSSKIDEYLSLKDKILQLQEQKRITEEKRRNAQKIAEEKAARAQQVKMMFEESQKSYEERLRLLRAYTQSLEAECEESAKGVELAENDAQMSENFILSQQEKTDANYRVIEEIDGLINGGDSDQSSKSK